ncbi:hypothetical protein A3Q56_02495 [Intoshia linei]|uniref:Uncharacterized protein n=1 Tax=Intoshia linei TaxID=1819745 RepID=A0A177B675_9BILA|nr:hypothetical protein A3Q56_02495 [Intoshia linei]
MYNPIFTQTIKSSFESVKAILLGDESCGKTSIALFGLDTTLTKNFKINQNCINFVEKKIKLSSTEKKIVLNLWDLTSSFIDNSFLEHVIPYTNIIFFVYDLTNSTSFDNLKDWLKIVKDIDKKLKVTRQYVLLANKSN